MSDFTILEQIDIIKTIKSLKLFKDSEPVLNSTLETLEELRQDKLLSKGVIVKMTPDQFKQWTEFSEYLEWKKNSEKATLKTN
jgi:hypothetical protein